MRRGLFQVIRRMRKVERVDSPAHFLHKQGYGVQEKELVKPNQKQLPLHNYFHLVKKSRIGVEKFFFNKGRHLESEVSFQPDREDNNKPKRATHPILKIIRLGVDTVNQEGTSDIKTEVYFNDGMKTEWEGLLSSLKKEYAVVPYLDFSAEILHEGKKVGHITTNLTAYVGLHFGKLAKKLSRTTVEEGQSFLDELVKKPVLNGETPISSEKVLPRPMSLTVYSDEHLEKILSAFFPGKNKQ